MFACFTFVFMGHVHEYHFVYHHGSGCAWIVGVGDGVSECVCGVERVECSYEWRE